MDVVLTRTGSPLPDANRAGPSTLIKAGDTHILVDCGRGVIMCMTGAGTLPPFLAGMGHQALPSSSSGNCMHLRAEGKQAAFWPEFQEEALRQIARSGLRPRSESG